MTQKIPKNLPKKNSCLQKINSPSFPKFTKNKKKSQKIFKKKVMPSENQFSKLPKIHK